jgi:predicted PurR-regulated permease PerM
MVLRHPRDREGIVTAGERDADDKVFLKRALEVTLHVGLVLALVAWCFQIVRPFVVPVVWGVIIAVAGHPGYRRLEIALGGRRTLAAILFTLLALVVLIVPTVLLADTLVGGAQILAGELGDGRPTIPPPPDGVRTWPLIGQPLAEIWGRASANLSAVLREIAPQLRDLGTWLLSGVADVGFGILQFIFAIVIAGVLLAHAEGGERAAGSIAHRIAGDRGEAFADLAGATVRNVARGILGVALIQALLAGLGFLAVGLPAAGLLALLCLLLSTVQIGIAPVAIPAVIYVFSVEDTAVAVAFLVWNILVLACDNVLKPILLGRGARVPMVVVFVGAIGGFLASGIIGLFVGAVVLSLGYTLFLVWLRDDVSPVAGTGADGP